MNDLSTDPTALHAMTTDIVSAFLSKNHLPPADVPNLVVTVHKALVDLAQADATVAVVEKPQPTPAEIRKSITPEALVSFLDGKPYKMLRRHLGLNGLDADSYRAKFGLPADYPMTAPNYSARRSELARNLGLGHALTRAQRKKPKPQRGG